MTLIRTVEELNALYGGTSEASLVKVTSRLTAEYTSMIEVAPFAALATVGPEGLDCSPRGDDACVVRIADDKTVLMPDWRGNNRVDSARQYRPRSARGADVPGAGLQHDDAHQWHGGRQCRSGVDWLVRGRWQTSAQRHRRHDR